MRWLGLGLSCIGVDPVLVSLWATLRSHCGVARVTQGQSLCGERYNRSLLRVGRGWHVTEVGNQQLTVNSYQDFLVRALCTCFGGTVSHWSWGSIFEIVRMEIRVYPRGCEPCCQSSVFSKNALLWKMHPCPRESHGEGSAGWISALACPLV